MADQSETVAEPPRSKYPKAVAFIISNEFCERFNYYGMRTILVLYLRSKLHYDEEPATVLFHVFTMLAYLSPLLGAIVADSWWGKFKTILYLSVVYAIGCVIISMGAIPSFPFPVQAATIAGLVLIAIGTGGIKPCVSAFGGDQFKLPEQAKELATFFSLFYFAINAGSMVSTTLTPILRSDVHCFGEHDCFSLAFGIPAALMLFSVVIFVSGKKMYEIKAPEGNMILGVGRCISNAISVWRVERKIKPRKHWLDYATEISGPKMVSDTKCLLKILVLYLPFPIYWALFDQQGSRWTFQATRMDGDFLGINIKPDQMQVVNPLLILFFIPLFEYSIYPCLAKIGIKRPLQKLTMGASLAAVSFILSALLELKLEAAGPLPLDSETAQLRFYNGMPCRYNFTSDLYQNATNENISYSIDSLDMWSDLAVPTKMPATFAFSAESDNAILCPDITGHINLLPGKATSYFIVGNELLEFNDEFKKSMEHPVLRVLINTAFNESQPEEAMISLKNSDEVNVHLGKSDVGRLTSIAHGQSEILIDGKSIAKLETRIGGVYAIIINGSQQDGYLYKLIEVIPANTVSMLWQLPQIIVITGAEIMFSVTALEFSFTQAPQSMKSVLQACYLLTVAFGNMIVVVIAEFKLFKSQASEFMLFAILMIIDMGVFILLAMRYKYVNFTQDAATDDKSKQAEADKGVNNEAFDSTIP